MPIMCDPKNKTVAGFMNKTFPQINHWVSYNSLDVIISLLTLTKPHTMVSLLDSGILNKNYQKGYLPVDEELVGHYKSMEIYSTIFESITEDFFANLTINSLEAILKMVWFSKLPCFDVPGMTGAFNGENTFLKYCSWKGIIMLLKRKIKLHFSYLLCLVSNFC